MTTPSSVGLAPPEPDHDHIVILRGATWADFQRRLAVRGDAAGPRFAYLRGSLEIMNPSRSHERIKSMLGRLVEAWCFERGVAITPYGAWTLESEEAERGAEPDECYVLGDDPDPERPDLAIEVVWTSGRLDKLEIYGELGVREVWYWRRGKLTLFALRGVRYVEIEASGVLSGIDHQQLLRFVDRTPMTAAVRDYRLALREG